MILPLMNLLELKEEFNNHSQGSKRVYVRNSDTNSTLTQFAYGKLDAFQSVETHSHQTMDEYFYVIAGNGTLILDGQELAMIPNSFIRIRAKSQHQFLNKNNTPLEFVYFGIAVEEGA